MHGTLISPSVKANSSKRSFVISRFILDVLAIALAIIGLAFAIGYAHAQTAQPAIQPTYGPAVAGICVFSRDAAIDNSAAGQAATKRMQELTTQVNADLQPERDAIAKEQAALSDKTLHIPAGDLKSRSDALSVRAVAFAQKVDARNAQLADARRAALGKLTAGLRPVLSDIITTDKCSAVFERGNIYGFNPKMDITPEVTVRLNAALKPFSFDLAAPQVRSDK